MKKTTKHALNEQANALLAAIFAPLLRKAKEQGSVAIYGAGAAGQYVALLCAQQGICPVGFIDDYCPETHVAGLPVLPAVKGLEKWRPVSVILGTMVSAVRMARALKLHKYTGNILCPCDPIYAAVCPTSRRNQQSCSIRI